MHCKIFCNGFQRIKRAYLSGRLTDRTTTMWEKKFCLLTQSCQQRRKFRVEKKGFWRNECSDWKHAQSTRRFRVSVKHERLHWKLKGIVHQNWIYSIFFVFQQKTFLIKIPSWWNNSDYNNWEKWCSKSVLVICIIIYITLFGQNDFVDPIFSIISSQSCFIEMDP